MVRWLWSVVIWPGRPSRFAGVDGAGEIVVRPKLRRGQRLGFFTKLPACLVGRGLRVFAPLGA